MAILEELGCGVDDFKYSEAVEATVRPSRFVAVAVLAAAAATAATLALTPLAPSLRAAAYLLLAAAAGEAAWRVGLRRGRRGVCHFRLDASGHIVVRDGAGRARTGQVQAGSFVAPWLTILRWRPEGARFDRTFLIAPGMLDAEAFRRLRVLLRWQ